MRNHAMRSLLFSNYYRFFLATSMLFDNAVSKIPSAVENRDDRMDQLKKRKQNDITKILRSHVFSKIIDE